MSPLIIMLAIVIISILTFRFISLLITYCFEKINEYHRSWKLVAAISTALLMMITACSTPEQEPPVEQTVRDFLKPGEDEPTSLGLYSYLLFGSAGDSNYDLKIAAIKAYLSNFNTYKETGIIKNGKKFNGFFVFTREDAEWIDQCDRTTFVLSVPNDPQSPKVPAWTCSRQKKNYTIDELAQWIVPRLDYPRAQELIGKLRDIGAMTTTDGIYLVSYLASVAKDNSVDPAYVLVQDLSKLPPTYMGSWVQLTAKQFTKPHYWDKDTLDYAMLDIRTTLAEIAPGVKLTESALASEIVKRIWPDK
jgi:hypothetical protein